jgi:hypothetical protein
MTIELMETMASQKPKEDLGHEELRGFGGLDVSDGALSDRRFSLLPEGDRSPKPNEFQSLVEPLNSLAVSDAMISGIDRWDWGLQWVFD